MLRDPSLNGWTGRLQRSEFKLTCNDVMCLSDQEPPLQTELPMSQAVQTSIIPSREDVDPDIFATMTSLQCFRNESKLYDALLSP